MSIADKLNTIYNCKQDIKQALSSKGVEVGDQLNTYAEKILEIKGSSNISGLSSDDSDNIITALGMVVANDFAQSQAIQDYINSYDYSSNPNFFCGSQSVFSNITVFPPNINFSPLLPTCSIRLQGMMTLQIIPSMDFSYLTKADYLFGGLTNLKCVGDIDLSGATSCRNLFDGGNNIVSIGNINTSSATVIDLPGQANTVLQRIESFSVKQITGFRYTYSRSVRYMVVKDIGTNENCGAYNFYYADNWGIPNDAVPDARQSVIDSLLTYSFDRNAAGYEPVAINLFASHFSTFFTDEEISQIKAKGYKIVVSGTEL